MDCIRSYDQVSSRTRRQQHAGHGTGVRVASGTWRLRRSCSSNACLAPQLTSHPFSSPPGHRQRRSSMLSFGTRRLRSRQDHTFGGLRPGVYQPARGGACSRPGAAVGCHRARGGMVDRLGRWSSLLGPHRRQTLNGGVQEACVVTVFDFSARKLVLSLRLSPSARPFLLSPP